MLGGLLATLLVIAGLAFIIGGPNAAGKVMASPFSLLGWIVRGVLGAFGKAVARIFQDAHRFFFRRWPGYTLGFYGALVLLVALWLYFF